MEMVRLRIGKTPVPRKIRNQTLSDQEYDEYARLAGQMTKKALNGYINSPHWRMVPDSGKEIAIDHAFEASPRRGEHHHV